jgi:glutamate/tyrosine decarboxylase-like PLP-dependent enzyme
MIPEEYLRRLPQLLSQIEDRLSSADSEQDSASGSGLASGNASGSITGSAPGLTASRMADKNATQSRHESTPDELDEALQDLVDRLVRHYPFHQPFYAGQMLKPPHPAAWLAYALAMTINPNNHALDGGPEASYMEKEVVSRLRHMVGFPDEAIGHLTSSGTIANLEALWVARELHPDRPVAISGQAHYTHQRMCQLLRHPVITLPEDEDGLPDPFRLPQGSLLPGTIVVTLGTTGTGRVEPLHKILPWAVANGVRIHVDAAYGGFFRLIFKSGLLDPAPWEALSAVDSIVIDPHKHGLQPYGCGSVLFRDPTVGKLYRHDSPYTYFTSDDLHLGEISLECSRAGASAIALWFTMKLLMQEAPSVGPDAAGSGRQSSRQTDPELSQSSDHSGTPAAKSAGLSAGLPQMLADCRKAALQFYDKLSRSDRFQPVIRPELDIVTYIPVTGEHTCSAVTRASEVLMKLGMDAASSHDKLYLSTLVLGRAEAERWLPGLECDADHVRVLRSVMMKPGHLDAIPDIMGRLERLHARYLAG